MHQCARQARAKSKDTYKIKRSLSKFLWNGENSTCMIELLFKKIKEKRLNLLNDLLNSHISKSACH